MKYTHCDTDNPGSGLETLNTIKHKDKQIDRRADGRTVTETETETGRDTDIDRQI